MRIFLGLILTFFTFSILTSQELVTIDEIYINNKLAYKDSTDELFTGIAQRKRKNGHLVYEEEYKNGIILSSNLYYNGKGKRVSNRTVFNPNKTFVLSKEIKFHLNGDVFETITYNEEGSRVLVEQFENEKLIYRCQYLGKRKHGIEENYEKNGEQLIYRCEYANGKKNGKEYCLNKKGVEIKKEYLNGKKVK